MCVRGPGIDFRKFSWKYASPCGGLRAKYDGLNRMFADSRADGSEKPETCGAPAALMVSTILRQGSEQCHRRSHPQPSPFGQITNREQPRLPLNHAHSREQPERVERSSIAL